MKQDNPPPERNNRFRFKTFAERVNEVEVDVYRRLQPVRSTPAGGSSSFFQEALSQWRELNVAADFLRVAATVHPWCMSLPQLLHHRNDILQTLLGALTVDARLSLEPLLNLTAVLARDLQQEYVQMVPAVMKRLTELLASGGDRDPDLLEHTFSCVSLIFKYLAKHLVNHLPSVLKNTSALRYSQADYVRCFAAEAVGYLLRMATTSQLRQAVRSLLAEQALRPTEARTHGAGLLLAESVISVNHTLHSRTEAVMKLMIQEDLLKVEDLKGAGKGKSLPKGLNREALRARSTRVAAAALDRLLEHVRRGHCSVLWSCMEGECMKRMDNYLATASSMEDGEGEGHVVVGSAGGVSDTEAARRSLARCVSLLAQMVEYFRGSRVEMYDTLLELSKKLLQPPMMTDNQQGGGVLAGDKEPYLEMSLSWESRRLVLAIIYGHGKVVGASQGLPTLTRWAPQWQAALRCGPPMEVLEFIQGLLSNPNGSLPVLSLFGPQVLGALGGYLMSSWQEEEGHTVQPPSVPPSSVLPLLLDVQQVLTQEASGGVPLLLMAQPLGLRLAAAVRQHTSVWVPSGGKAATMETWVLLQLLPSASENADQVMDVAEGLLSKVAKPLMAHASGEAEERQQPNTNTLTDLLLLYSTAVQVLVGAMPTMPRSKGFQLEAIAEGVLAMASQHPDHYSLVVAAGKVLGCLQQLTDPGAPRPALLNLDKLKELMPMVSRGLMHPSQKMRAANLQLLLSFFPDQGADAPPSSPQEIFRMLLTINTEHCTIDNGRKWAVAIGRIKGYLEYHHVQAEFISPIVSSLLGLLYTRFSPLWVPTCEALGAALDAKYIKVSWPLLHHQLCQAQEDFLHKRDGRYDSNNANKRRKGSRGDMPEPEADDEVADEKGVQQGGAGQQELPTLGARWSMALEEGSVESSGGCTDAGNRLCHCLKAMGYASHQIMESVARDWMKLYLDYAAVKQAQMSASGSPGRADEDDKDEEGEEEEEVQAGILTKDDLSTKTPGSPSLGGKAWRGQMKSWLDFLSGLKGLRGVHGSSEVLLSVASQLLQIDCPLQISALRCLKAFKIKYLTPYMEPLMKIADNNSLREGALFPISKGAEDGFLDEHRPGILPVWIHILFPKLRKRSGRLGGKGAPGSARAAILNSLAALEPSELKPLITLFLEPLGSTFREPEEEGLRESARKRRRLNDSSIVKQSSRAGASSARGVSSTPVPVLFPLPWWSSHLDQEPLEWWMTVVNGADLAAQPVRRQVGFLNAFEDLLRHLGFRLEPYLPVLLAITLRLLQHATAPQEGPADEQAALTGVTAAANLKMSDCVEAQLDGRAAPETALDPAHAKEIRTQALKLMAQIWSRYPASLDYNILWAPFLHSVAPMLSRLPPEAASDKAPVLVECVQALAAAPGLARILADLETTQEVHPQGEADANDLEAGNATLGQLHPCAIPKAVSEVAGSKAADTRGLGSQLMKAAIVMLSVPQCSDPCRQAVLDILESLLQLEVPLLHAILSPWMNVLLQGLKDVVVNILKGPVSRTPLKGKMKHKANRRPNMTRELTILEQLGGHVQSSEAAWKLADALVQLTGGGGKAKKHGLTEYNQCRTLGALQGVWLQMASMGLRLDNKGTCEERPEAMVVDTSAIGEDGNRKLLKYWESMAPQLVRLTTRDARVALCKAYVALNGLLPELSPSGQLVSDLNAWSESELDQPDYDRRLGAYMQLTPSFWASMSAPQALPLLMTCHYDLRNGEDLALRQAAAQAVSRFIEGMVQLQSSLTSAMEDQTVVEALPDSCKVQSSRSSVSSLLSQIVYPRIKSNVGSKSLAVRQEHLALLRQLALQLPSQFPSLGLLTSSNEETDFFTNAAHIQLHRRGRALLRVKQIVTEANSGQQDTSIEVPGDQPNLPQLLVVLGDVVQPLLQQTILDGTSEGDRAHDKKQGDVDREANVLDAAVQTLGAIAGVLPWLRYQQLLGQYVRIMSKGDSRGVIRAVCAILDSFHFDLQRHDGASSEQHHAAEAVEVDKTADKEGEAPEELTTGSAAIAEDGDEEVEDGDEQAPDVGDMGEGEVAAGGSPLPTVTPAFSRTPYQVLVGRVLPELRKQLVKDGEVVRAPVALALVRVVKRLDEDTRKKELPRVLQGVANLLSQRLQRIRDDTRAVLVSMAKELGSEYLPFICHVLRAALPEKGFTAHVIGYTIHAILATLVPGSPPGGLDTSVELILPLLDGELFGAVAEAKEVSQFASNYKEAKRCRAYESYQLLATGITFETHIEPLLLLVRGRLPQAGQPTTRNKLTQLLQYAARGVANNSTADACSLGGFVYNTLDCGLAKEEQARKEVEAGPQAAISLPGQRSVKGLDSLRGAAAEAAKASAAAAAEVQASLHEHLLVEFALSILNSSMKKGVLSGRSLAVLGYLDPLLPLLVRALGSRSTNVVGQALKCLSFMVHLPLPGLASCAEAAGQAVATLLQRLPNVQHPLAQDCLKLLAGMMQECSSYQPTTSQIRYLLKWSGGELEDTGERQTIFGLLRSVLSRNLVVPEVYDIMNKVQSLMVQSHAAPVRQLCASLLLQFLLDYPLGPRRLEQHVQFVVANLGYEHESGRLQVLQMLQQIIQKFPSEVIASLADLMSLALITRLVNDTSHVCRNQVAETLKMLFKALDAHQVDTTCQFCLRWMGSSPTTTATGKEVQDEEEEEEEGDVHEHAQNNGQDQGPQTGALQSAAAQCLGLVAEVEGKKFSRRLDDFLQAALPILQLQVDCTGQGTSDEEGDLLQCPGWQQAYYCLLTLEKASQQGVLVPPDAGGPLLLWKVVMQLLVHPHLWLRKVSARLVGVALADVELRVAVIGADKQLVPHLALLLYRQLEGDVVDEALCVQAVKCLVSVAALLHQMAGAHTSQEDSEAEGLLNGIVSSGGIPEDEVMAEAEGGNKRRRVDHYGIESGELDHGDPHDTDGGDPDQEHEEDEKGEEVELNGTARSGYGYLEMNGAGLDGVGDDEYDEGRDDDDRDIQIGGAGLSFKGLAWRMVKLAEDPRMARHQQRMAALRWLLAVGVQLGGKDILPFLPLFLRPFYRVMEGGALVHEDVKMMVDEALAMWRQVVGADDFLAGYNAAREQVKALRLARKRRSTLQAMLEPEERAKQKVKRNLKKQINRKRKIEDAKRVRSARTYKGKGKFGGKQGGRQKGKGKE